MLRVCFIDFLFISSSVFPLLSVWLVFTACIYSTVSTADKQRTQCNKYFALFYNDLKVQQWHLTSQLHWTPDNMQT